jgi:4a-hydroxytetrahydrobiopterin dehydratase
MPSRTPLEPAAVDSAVAEIPGWERSGDAITREYRLGGFREAVAFIVRVAFEAEALDHHPEITNVYDRVSVRLSTHDAGDRVTEMDIELARRIEALNA